MTARSKSRPKTVSSRSNYVNYPMVRLMRTQRSVLKDKTYSVLSSTLAYTIFALFFLLNCLSCSCIFRSISEMYLSGVSTFLATPSFLDAKLSRGVCTTSWCSELSLPQTRQECCKTNPELKHVPSLQSVMWFLFHNAIEKYWIYFKCLIKYYEIHLCWSFSGLWNFIPY